MSSTRPRRRGDALPQILPNFLIIGAPRSGTTSLSEYLGTHPQVFTSREKELHFFDRRFHRGVEWYARQFARAKGKIAIGEATARYMYGAEVMARMHGLLPEAKLIAILRNPVDRAYSHYWYFRARGWEPLDFAGAIAAEEREAQAHSRARRFYLEGGRYLKYLRVVCESYPRDALLVLLFDDLHAAPGATFTTVCRFLGVDDTFVPPNLGELFFRYKEFRSILLSKAARKFVPEGLIKDVLFWMLSRPASYPPLDPVLRRDLQERFAADNAALAAWLGRDLSSWSAPAVTGPLHH